MKNVPTFVLRKALNKKGPRGESAGPAPTDILPSQFRGESSNKASLNMEAARGTSGPIRSLNSAASSSSAPSRTSDKFANIHGAPVARKLHDVAGAGSTGAPAASPKGVGVKASSIAPHEKQAGQAGVDLRIGKAPAGAAFVGLGVQYKAPGISAEAPRMGGGHEDMSPYQGDLGQYKQWKGSFKQTSGYNPRGVGGRVHHGYDYAVPHGTQLYSAFDGAKVTFIGQKGGYGNTVIYEIAPGHEILLGHLDSFPKGLKVGDRVNRNTPLGRSGASGTSRGKAVRLPDGRVVHGAHVHEEFRIGGNHTSQGNFFRSYEKNMRKSFVVNPKELLGLSKDIPPSWAVPGSGSAVDPRERKARIGLDPAAAQSEAGRPGGKIVAPSIQESIGRRFGGFHGSSTPAPKSTHQEYKGGGDKGYRKLHTVEGAETESPVKQGKKASLSKPAGMGVSPNALSIGKKSSALPPEKKGRSFGVSGSWGSDTNIDNKHIGAYVSKEASPDVRLKMTEGFARVKATPQEMAFVYATYRQESGFDPNAYNSGSQAAGIGQFIPTTAKAYGVNTKSVSSSTMGTVKYHRDLRNMFNGNQWLMFAGYNRGQGNVMNDLKAAGIPKSQWGSMSKDQVKAVVRHPETKGYLDAMSRNLSRK